MHWLQALPSDEQAAEIAALTTPQRAAAYEWLHRWEPLPHQAVPDGDWFIWVMQWGAGAGKTFSGAQFVRCAIDSGLWRTVNVAGPTWVDTTRTMVNGSVEAPGLMDVWPPHQRPTLRLSKDDPYLLCHNGAKIQLFSAQKAERFRGPAADGAWFDEVDAWKPEGMPASEAFALAEQRIRSGSDPRIICTTTPKRQGLCKELVARDDSVVTRATMYDNRSNLSAKYVRTMEARYGGTRLGRQELEGEILPDVEGAIVTLAMIDAQRIDLDTVDAAHVDILKGLERVCIGVDPFGGGGDACGISAAAKGGTTAYVLADRTCKLGPDGWGRRVMETTLEFAADCIAVEKNYGGDMCKANITHAAKTMGVPVPRIVEVTSTKAKHIRFERTTGAKYERGEMVHVGRFAQLEDEITQFTPQGFEGGKSPNSADALVFAIEELFPSKKKLTMADLYG